MRESDLYPPLKAFLSGQGYAVKSEIENCDVVAIRDESIVIVELKLRLNLAVLLQAVDRLKLSNTIYIGVPQGLAILKKQRKQIIKLMRMLGLGLLVIEPNAAVGNVDVLVDPQAYKPRQIKQQREKLLGEFMQRVGDPNRGGTSTKQGIMTAYRQKALAIASHLQEQGPTKAANIAVDLAEPKARLILYNNVYGWFEREGKGVYALSSRGAAELQQWLKDS